MKERITKKLSEGLQPQFLEVKNNSQLHQGHSGHDHSGETHFAVIIESVELKKLNRVAAHRQVKELLKDEFEKGLHALEIKLR